MEKPNCYQCKWRGEVPGSAHSCCEHPDAKQDSGSLLGLMAALSGGHMPQVKTKLNVKGNPHGMRNDRLVDYGTCFGDEGKDDPAVIVDSFPAISGVYSGYRKDPDSICEGKW